MSRPCIPSDLRDTFESAIDLHGLANVVDALAEICTAKADHIRSNWQDRATAAPWVAASAQLQSLEAKIAAWKL